MGIFTNPKFKKLATNLFVASFIAAASVVPLASHAQDASAPPNGSTPPVTAANSPYKTLPTCPAGMKNDVETECRYADNSVALCTKSNGGSITSVDVNYTCKNQADNSKTVCLQSSGGTRGQQSSVSCTVTLANGQTSTTQTTGDELGTNKTTDCSDGSCTTTNQASGPGTGGDLLGIAIQGVALFILMMASAFLAWIGMAFNWVVINTVFDFGAIFGASQSMLTAWGVMRDVGNIILLFGFILMGVLTILNLHDYPVKKTIPGLIIFAVLLNFSLFASQTVIDVANAFSAVFYEQASTQCEAGVKLEDCIKSDSGGISGIIAQQAGVTSAFSISQANQIKQTEFGKGIIMLGLALFVTVAAIVLLAATIMLVIRAVVLCFLMVISPIGFAGMAIPPLKGLAKSWWQQLLKQAFFAPVFLLLIFVSLKLTEGISKGVLEPDKGLANALAGGTFGGMGIVVTFMVVIGFMIASLVAATKVGAMGAGFATNFAGAAVLGGMARATNFAVGGAGFVGRNVVQRTGLNKVPGADILVNRAFRPMEKANMDLRRVPGMGAALGLAGITSGAKPSEHIAFADMNHQFHDALGGKKGKALRAEYDKEVKDWELEGWAHGDQKYAKMDEEMIRYLGKMSTKELEQLHGIKEGLDKMATNLSPDQFAALMKSENLTSGEKKKLSEGRFKNLTKALALPATTSSKEEEKKNAIKAQLKAMSNKDLEHLDPATLANQLILDNLSEKQRDHLINKEGRTPNEVQRLKDSSKVGKINAALRDTKSIAAALALLPGGNLSSFKAAEVAKLDEKILRDATLLNQLTPQHLAKIVSEDVFDSATLSSFANELRAGGNDAMKTYLRKHPSGKML